jgi:NADH-quinone oxidoreductase subunit B
LNLLQDAVAHERRPLSWVIGEDRVVKKKTSQRDLRTPERMRATNLAEPTSVGAAPLAKDVLRAKVTEDGLK